MTTSIWAIADLHLSFGCPSKNMSKLFKVWDNYEDIIYSFCHDHIKANDIIIIAGDISWAMKKEDVIKDLQFISSLPGNKIMIKGNHDYWAPQSQNKINALMPDDIQMIYNGSIIFNEYNLAITGSRLWNNPKIKFNPLLFNNTFDSDFKCADISLEKQDAKIFERELARLERNLQSIPPNIKHIIAMTHYPPISSAMEENEITRLLEKYNVSKCIFGHLHGIKPDITSLFGVYNNIEYILSSADFLKFHPIKIYDI